MKNLQTLYEECRKELEGIGIRPLEISSVKKGNAVKTIGCVYIDRSSGKETRTIKISKVVLADDVPVAFTKKVIIHEILHCCEGAFNHGEKWKRLAETVNKKLGYNISRYYDPSEVRCIENEQRKKAKYIFRCTGCGQTVYRYRRSKSADNFCSLYRCSKCGGSFETIKGAFGITKEVAIETKEDTITKEKKGTIDLDKVIVVRVETTTTGFHDDTTAGFHDDCSWSWPEKDEIIQVVLIDGKGAVLMDQLIKPEAATKWPASHGITPDIVKDAPRIHDVKGKIEELIDEAEVIVMSTRFEKKRIIDDEGIKINGKQIILLDQYTPDDDLSDIEMIAKRNHFSPVVIRKNSVEKCRLVLYLFLKICQEKGISIA